LDEVDGDVESSDCEYEDAEGEWIRATRGEISGA
jgi:hypothetical protein